MVEGAFSIVVRHMPSGERDGRSVALAVSKALHVPAADVAPLLVKLPVTLPQRFDETSARELVAALGQLGVASEMARKVGPVTSCEKHAALEASAQCSRCDAPRCALCSTKADLCSRCQGKAQRSRVFFHLRITFLLGVLVIVVLFALRDVNRRHARTDWTKTLTVAIVLLRRGPVDPAAIDKLRDRVHALEARLTDECRRHGSVSMSPFRLELYGPVDVASGPPVQPEEGVVALARYTFDLWQYLRGVNARVELRPSAVDASIYVLTRPPRAGRPTMVEGASQEGGKVGLVEVDLDRDIADCALFVAAHELLHTLGATDKYGVEGRARVPEGLAEPERVPLYPQQFAEIMARNVPLGPSIERPPETLDELRVGSATAREIGWSK